MMTFPLLTVLNEALCTSGFLGSLLIIVCLVLASEKQGEKKRRSLHADLTVGFMAGANMLICALSGGIFILISVGNISSFCKFLMFLLCDFVFCSIWFTALLCFLYCLKILSFPHSLFVQMKSSIPKLVICGLIYGLFAGTIFSGASLLYFLPPSLPLNATNSSLQEIYAFSRTSKWIFLAFFWLCWVSFPFTVAVVSCVAILSFLCRHMQKVKDNGSRISNFESHIRVIQMLSCQVFLYVVLLFVILSSTILAQIDKLSISELFLLVYPLYCSATSINLIVKHGSIRRRMQSLIRKIFCFA
uniref:Taste receptor type 2 n=1 Tax=Erpetoichthys calabaricus TaxID=27687 RepID=A0A8C4SZX3_ERPCA